MIPKFTTLGSGPTTVLMLHGIGGGHVAFAPQVETLAGAGYRAVAWDMPGYGHSAPIEPYTFKGLAQSCIDLIDALQCEHVVLVGHSMGGMVISALAEQAPERVAELVYVAGYLPQHGESLYKIAMTDADSRVGAYWTQADPKAYTPASLRPEGIAEVFCADCNEADQRTLVSSHKAEAVPPLGTPVSLSAARFGRVPRSYVHTRQDNAVSFKLQQNMLARAGGVRQTWELNTSHLPMLTQPRALADILADVAR